MSDATHAVFNQSPAFKDLNLYSSDAVLMRAVAANAGAALNAATAASLTDFGARTGSAAAFERGRLANENPPKLRAFDAKGHRLDQVEFHPAYHECMAISMAEGLHCGSWQQGTPSARAGVGANVIRAAGSYMAAQMEAGHCCPITMTNAAVATLLGSPELAAQCWPKILSRDYDPAFVPSSQKRSMTIGMGMTEKQGGTDVRANTTVATATATAISSGHTDRAGKRYTLTGHKWFMSAPMCDAFLVLAQAPRGLSCFWLPRFREDGRLNAIHIQRLKDKLGNRSNASSEVEFHAAEAELIGEEGRGVAAIIEMVTYTRLDCAVASAGMMRLAVAHAIHHCRHRQVFGANLIAQPLMRAVLADLTLESAAATVLAFRLARSFDHPDDALEQAWRRLMTPVTKYWVCKAGAALAYEAMECLGGNGYVEEGLLARLYRELPVNAIWEGSGNVMCLDVLRVISREPAAAELVFAEIAQLAGDDADLSARLAGLKALIARPADLEANARQLVEGLALTAAAGLLRQQAPAAYGEAFIASRLRPGLGGRHFGAGLGAVDLSGILDWTGG